MNLRILKKLSKRAAPLLADMRISCDEQYRAVEYEDSYTSSCKHDRKHHERSPARYPTGFHGTRYYMPRHGLCHVAIRQPCTVWPGTEMLGSMVGYEEREWEEDDAWSVLRSRVFDHFTDIVNEWNAAKGEPDFEFQLKRKLNNPAMILSAAVDIVAAKQAKEAGQ